MSATADPSTGASAPADQEPPSAQPAQISSDDVPVPGSVRPMPVGEPGQPRPKRRTSTTNLLLALAVTCALVALVVLLVPRPKAISRPPANVPAAAQQWASSLTFTPSTAVPTGWRATSADVRRDSGNLDTWTVNYLTDANRYVGLMQANDWSQAWQSSLTQGGTPQPSVEIAGATWQVFFKQDKQITSLMLRRPGMTTLILANGGGVAEATVLAKRISPLP